MDYIIVGMHALQNLLSDVSHIRLCAGEPGNGSIEALRSDGQDLSWQPM